MPSYDYAACQLPDAECSQSVVEANLVIGAAATLKVVVYLHRDVTSPGMASDDWRSAPSSGKGSDGPLLSRLLTGPRIAETREDRDSSSKQALACKVELNY